MALTKAKLIANNSATAAVIAANTVGSSEIAQNSVTSVQIPNNSLGTTQVSAAMMATKQNSLTSGDITSAMIANNSVTIAKLAVTDGTSGQVLKTDGSGTLSFGTATTTTINNNSNNRVITGSGTANTLEAEANLVYDGTNLGVGITSPARKLHVQGSSASTYSGAGPSDTLRVSQSTNGNFISSEVDGKFAYFGVDANGAKFAGYDYANNANIDVMIGQNTFFVKSQHFEVTGSAALTGSFNSTHSNGPYIRFQESGADKFYIGASSAVSGGTYTGYDLYAATGKTVQIFAEGRTGSIASLQVKSNHIIVTQDINANSTTGDNVDVDKTEEGAVHIKTETGNARASAITFQAGSYLTQSAITSVHNTSEGTNVAIHTTDSYNDGPKERFRVDHLGHSRGVSFRGTKTAQPAFVLGGGDVIKQNLKLYYNFADSRCYGTSGSTVTDLSGNNQTGYLGANVSYSSTAGGIMDFAGGNTNNGAFIGTPLALPTTDSVSLMFWIYYDDQPASPGDYQLMGWQANGGYAYFGVSAGGPSYGYIGRSSNIAEANHIIGGQKWHHLCVTRDRGDLSHGRSYTYIDGILTGFRKSEDPYAHSQTMTVGALGGASNGSGSAGHTLDGKIASVAVYDRALTLPEIHHNMMVDIHRLVGT